MEIQTQRQTIPFPVWDELYPHQRAVLQSPQRFKTLIWHRKARKTTTAVIETVRQALHRVGTYWIVLPTYANAKDIVWRDPNMIFRIIPPQIITKRNEQELVIYLSNGSYIQLKGADEPEGLRGPNPFGIVYDEFATMKYEAWSIMEPVLRANDGWAWFVGTPRGKNHLHKHYLRGQEGDIEWGSWLMKASISGVIDPFQLAKSRETMSDDTYMQEWECTFLEGSGVVFRGLKEVMTAKPIQPDENKLYVVGVDLAKHHDFTVLAVYDASTNSQVYQDRFQGIDWVFQKKKIKALSDHYNHALVVLDATGLGDPIYDDLVRSGVPVEPYKLTERTKADLIEKHSIYIQQQRIKMLPIEQSIREHEDFTYTIGQTGVTHYSAPDGEEYFDDCVIANALAVWKLQPLYKESIVKPRSRIGQHYDRLKADQSEDTLEAREFAEWSNFD